MRTGQRISVEILRLGIASRRMTSIAESQACLSNIAHDQCAAGIDFYLSTADRMVNTIRSPLEC